MLTASNLARTVRAIINESFPLSVADNMTQGYDTACTVERVSLSGYFAGRLAMVLATKAFFDSRASV